MAKPYPTFTAQREAAAPPRRKRKRREEEPAPTLTQTAQREAAPQVEPLTLLERETRRRERSILRTMREYEERQFEALSPRLAAIERNSGSLIPTKLQLKMAESMASTQELEALSGRIGRRVSLSPLYVFGKVRLEDHTDPVHGGKLRLSTLVRMLPNGWEGQAVMNLLRSNVVQEEVTGGLDALSGPIVIKKYRADAVEIARLLLPMTRVAPDMELHQGISLALRFASEGISDEDFEQNLRVVNKAPGYRDWDWTRKVTLAASLTADGQRLENTAQFSQVMWPGLAKFARREQGLATAKSQFEEAAATSDPRAFRGGGPSFNAPRTWTRAGSASVLHAFATMDPEDAQEVAAEVFPDFERKVAQADALADEVERQVMLDETSFERSWFNQEILKPFAEFYEEKVYRPFWGGVTAMMTTGGSLAIATGQDEDALRYAEQRAAEVFRGEIRFADILVEDYGLSRGWANAVQFGVEILADPLIVGGKALKVARMGRVFAGLERTTNVRRYLFSAVAPDTAATLEKASRASQAARHAKKLDKLVGKNADDLADALISPDPESIGRWLVNGGPTRGQYRAVVERGRTPMPRGVLEQVKRGVQEGKMGLAEARGIAEETLRAVFTVTPNPPSPIVANALRAGHAQERASRAGLIDAANRFKNAQAGAPPPPSAEAFHPRDVTDEVELGSRAAQDLATQHIDAGLFDTSAHLPLRMEIPTRTRPLPFMGAKQFAQGKLQFTSFGASATGRKLTQLANVNPGEMLKMHEDPERWFSLRAKRARYTPGRVDYYTREASLTATLPPAARERRLLELNRELQTETVRRWAGKHLDPTAEVDKLTETVLENIAKAENRTYHEMFGVAPTPKGGTREITDILAESQLVNYAFAVDPLAIEHVLNQALGTGRRMVNALRRQKALAATDLNWGKVTADAALGAVGEVWSDFYRGWKSLAITRPAYMFRVILGDEGARSLVTIGSLFERLAAQEHRRLFQTRIAIGKAQRLGVAPETIMVKPTLRKRFFERAFSEDIVFPDGSTIRLHSPAFYDDDWRSVPFYSYEGGATWMREVEARTGLLASPHGYGVLTAESGEVYFAAWAHHLNDTFGYSRTGEALLGHVVAGTTKSAARADILRWVKQRNSPGWLERRAIGKGTKDVERWVEDYTDVVYAYTKGDQGIAQAALDQAVDPAVLRAFPADEMPKIHGPLLEEITGKGSRAGNMLKAGWDRWARTWIRSPEATMNRLPYTKVWKRRYEKSVAQALADQGVANTPELRRALDAASDDFALAHTKSVMFDFTENTRLGELVGMGVPFFQPFVENIAVWGHFALRRNPALIGYVKVLMDNAEESGFIRRDPETGEQVIPLEWFFFGVPTALMARFLPGESWGISSPLASFNMFYNNTIGVPIGGDGSVPIPTPGLTPWAGTALQWLSKDTDETWLYDYLFQFGPGPFNEKGDIDWTQATLGLLPTWLEKAVQVINPGAYEGIATSTAMDMLRAQQASGQEPNIEQAKAQARLMAAFKMFFGLFSPGTAIVEYPHKYLEDEYHALVDEHGYDTAADMFNTKYPEFSLITTGKTYTAKVDGITTPRIPPTDFAVKILRQPGFKEFANSPEGAVWAWALIAGREGNFDFPAFATQVSSGTTPYKTLKEFLKDGEQREFFEVYWPTKDALDRRIERLEDAGRYTDADTARRELSDWMLSMYKDYPRVAPEYIKPIESPTGEVVGAEVNFDGGGPGVIITEANVEAVLKNPYFMSTEVGKGLEEFWPLYRRTAKQLEDDGYYSLNDHYAKHIKRKYEARVADIVAKHPEFQTAYDYFFDTALSNIPRTKGDKQLDTWWANNDPRYAIYTSQMGEIERLSRRASQVDKPAERSEIYAHRTRAMNALYDQSEQWVLKTWWSSLSAGQKRQETQSVLTTPIEWWSRFDLQQFAGIKLSNRATKWVQQVGETSLRHAQKEEEDPGASSGEFARRDEFVKAHLGKDKSFDAFIAAANDPGYVIERITDYPKGPGKDSRAWQEVIRLAREKRRIAHSNDWHGTKIPSEFDPDHQRAYGTLRDIFVEHVQEWRDASERFDKQVEEFQRRSGVLLVDYFLPQIWFGPIGGKYTDPLPKSGETSKKFERAADKAKALDGTTPDSGGGGGSGGGFSGGGGSPSPSSETGARGYSAAYTLREGSGRFQTFREQLREALASGNEKRAKELRAKIRSLRQRLRKALGARFGEDSKAKVDEAMKALGDRREFLETVKRLLQGEGEDGTNAGTEG